MNLVNSQLPTANSQKRVGLNQRDEKRHNLPGCNVFHPVGTNDSAWELEVGS
jgi:hypothetical protein